MMMRDIADIVLVQWQFTENFTSYKRANTAVVLLKGLQYHFEEREIKGDNEQRRGGIGRGEGCLRLAGRWAGRASLLLRKLHIWNPREELRGVKF